MICPNVQGIKNKEDASQNSEKWFKPIVNNEMESSSSSNQEYVTEESESEVEGKQVQIKNKTKGRTEVNSVVPYQIRITEKIQ